MPLRSADSDAGPPREPCLTVSDVSRVGPELFLQLTGAALATLSHAAKRRLVAAALGQPRKTKLGIRTTHGSLGLYLSLTLPKNRLTISYPGFRIGALGRDGASLAVVDVARFEGSRVVIYAYGGCEAEELLLDGVREWKRRGRPTESDLDLRVTYVDDHPRLAVRWPPIARSAS